MDINTRSRVDAIKAELKSIMQNEQAAGLSLIGVEELQQENKALRRVIVEQGEQLGQLRRTAADQKRDIRMLQLENDYLEKVNADLQGNQLTDKKRKELMTFGGHTGIAVERTVNAISQLFDVACATVGVDEVTVGLTDGVNVRRAKGKGMSKEIHERNIYDVMPSQEPEKSRRNRQGEITVGVKVNADTTELDKVEVTLKRIDEMRKNLGLTKRQVRKMVQYKISTARF